MKFKMKSIQEIFNIAIETGHYDISCHPYEMKNMMCISLERCYDKGLVSWLDKFRAKFAINMYIRALTKNIAPNALLLTTAMNIAFIDKTYTLKDCLTIYQDWKSRPFPEK